MITTTSTIKREDLTLMIQLMELENSEFQNQEISIMSTQISKEFNVHCTEKMLEVYYSDEGTIVEEDWELESRRTEHNFYGNLQDYESRTGFKQIG